MRRIFIALSIFMLCWSSVAYARYEDAIVRRILTDIVWNEEKEYIEVHYIVIQKAPGEEVVHYPATKTIESDNMGEEVKNDEDAKKFVDQYDTEGVYRSDYIFGEQVDAYKNMIGQKVSEEEMNRIIALAESDVEKEYSKVIEKEGTTLTKENISRNDAIFANGLLGNAGFLISWALVFFLWLIF